MKIVVDLWKKLFLASSFLLFIPLTFKTALILRNKPLIRVSSGKVPKLALHYELALEGSCSKNTSSVKSRSMSFITKYQSYSLLAKEYYYFLSDFPYVCTRIIVTFQS